jgi:hypothetical protein
VSNCYFPTVQASHPLGSASSTDEHGILLPEIRNTAALP